MKFSELRIWEKLPSELDYDPFFLSEEFPSQNKVTKFFEMLSQFDSEEISAAERKAKLAAQAPEILEECDSLLHRQVLEPDSDASNAAVAALFAAKMQIYLRCDATENIKKQYNNFVRASVSLLNAAYQLNESEQKDFTAPLIKTARDLTLHLQTAANLKAEKATEEISVPDILSASTFVSDGEYNLNNVRKTWHQLWEIEALQPLLTFAAYATKGHRCNHKGEIIEGEKLQIVLINDKIARENSQQFTGLCAGQNVIFASTGVNEEHQKISSENYGATLAHELHHYWEESFYQSNQVLPYPFPPQETISEKIGKALAGRISLDDPNEEVKNKLDRMAQQALNIQYSDQEVVVKTRTLNGGTEVRPQPFATFNDFKNYTGVKENERIRHAEIVVRVSEVLSDICPTKKCSSQEGLQILRNAGLGECVDFFLQEKQQMTETCEKLQIALEVGFSTTTQPVTSVPEYLNYRATPLHEAVRNNDLSALSTLLQATDSTAKSSLQKDSLNQTALELAIAQDNPKSVFELCKKDGIYRELGSNPELLRQTFFYLVDTTKSENSEIAKEAFDLFQKAVTPKNYICNFRTIGRISYEAMVKGLDPDLVNKIKSNTAEEIVAAIGRGEIPFQDKFKNPLHHYAVKAFTKTKDRESFISKVQESYDICCLHQLVTKNEFLPTHPLRQSLNDRNSQKFLEKLKNPEINLTTLRQELSIFRPENNSAIELVAMHCNFKKEESPWFKIFKKIIHDYKIDPAQKYGTNDKTLLDLLPDKFLAEACSTYEEVTKSDVEKVAPKTATKILETTQLQSEVKTEKNQTRSFIK